jgi:plasmid stabilization system protein ParE
MRQLLIQPQARVDLLEIWHSIAPNSIRNANRVSDRLDQEIRGLLDMPGKGHGRADVKDRSYRFWSVYSYVIAYRFDDLTVTIVRVVHGRRNFRKLFGSRR